MLTPRFEVEQTSESVIVTVFAPFARIADVEISFTEDTFIFYCSPYYLRLNFNGKLIDSELEKHNSQYDGDRKAFVISCMKENPGVHFTGLDMLTALLTPKGFTTVGQPNIEVLSDEAIDESSENEWLIEQELVPKDETIFSPGEKYGFGGKNSGVFKRLCQEFGELIDVKDPDSKKISQRQEERLLDEQIQFDEDHYLADLYEDDLAIDAIEFIPQYYSVTSDEVILDEMDSKAMMNLPKRQYLLDPGPETTGVYMGLLDLIFSWCYNHRITHGDNCPETAWNIKKTSSTLSWLESFSDLKNVMVASIRRSLIFPLIRNWKLSKEVLKDTVKILSLGQKQVLKCLLEMHHLMNCEVPYYLLNELYITDYCIWIQQISNGKLIRLADDLKQIEISKQDLGLELQELESAAQMVLEDEKENIHKNTDLNSVSDDLHSLSIANSMATSYNENTSTPIVIPNKSCDKIIAPVSDRDSSSSDGDDSSTSSDSSEDSNGDQSSTSSSSSELDSDDDSDPS